jgi:hypothetical protein
MLRHASEGRQWRTLTVRATADSSNVSGAHQPMRIASGLLDERTVVA